MNPYVLSEKGVTAGRLRRARGAASQVLIDRQIRQICEKKTSRLGITKHIVMLGDNINT